MKKRKKFTYTFTLYDNKKGFIQIDKVLKKKNAKIKMQVDNLTWRELGSKKLIYKGPQILIRGNKEGLLYLAKKFIVLALSNSPDKIFHEHLEPPIKNGNCGPPELIRGSSPVVIDKFFDFQ